MKSFFLFSILSLFAFTNSFSQNGSGFGLKGGLNYNGNGDYFQTISDTAENPERNLGYHLGVFGKINLSKLYFRPELVYTSTKSTYTAGTYELKKIDAPLLLGIEIIGPLTLFAGPALQFILDQDLGNATISNAKNDFSIGLNLGVGVSFNNLGVDLRYERGLSENETTVLLNNTTINQDRLDTRPDQLILSLSYKL